MLLLLLVWECQRASLKQFDWSDTSADLWPAHFLFWMATSRFQEAGTFSYTVAMVAECRRKTKQWQDNYDAVLEYAKKNGNLKFCHSIPEERRLAGWLTRQKSRARLTNMEREKLLVLDKYYDNRPISVRRDEEWNSWFLKMMEYKEVVGDFIISKYDEGNHRLRRWIDRQRYSARHGTLTDERRKRLEEVGFVFKRCKSMNKKNRFTADQEKHWDKMYAFLCDYQKIHGHCDVPFHDNTYHGLATWVSSQRSVFRNGSIDETRKARLDALNFSWNKNVRQPLSL